MVGSALAAAMEISLIGSTVARSSCQTTIVGKIPILTNTGFYVVEPAVIERLEKDVPVSFPEIIEACRKNGERVGVYTVEEDQWLDMGQIEEMEKMEKRLTGLEMEE